MIRNVQLSLVFLMLATCFAGCDYFSAKKDSTKLASDKNDTKNPISVPGVAESIVPNSSASARTILEECVKTYKNLRSYEDRGVLKFRLPLVGKPVEESDAIRVAFDSPNRLAIQAFDVQSTWIGTRIETIIGKDDFKPFGNQRLVRPMPDQMDLDWLLIDNLGPHLDRPLTGVPIQLELLFAKQPLSYWLNDQTSLSLLAPERFDSALCDRVKVVAKLGDRDASWTLWIDQSNKLLRKYEMPFELIELVYANLGGLPKDLDKSKTELSIELLGATANGSIDWSIWNLPKREGEDVLVSRFIDAPPRNASPLLGKVVEPFDLRDAEGKIILDSAQRKKPISILLWVADDEVGEKFVKYALNIRQELERRLLMSAAEIVFVTKSPAKEMTAAFKRWNCDLPLAFDLDNLTTNMFGLHQQPAVVVLDKNACLQYIDPMGFIDNVPSLVEALKNGEDPARRYLQNTLDDEARFVSRLHRAVINKADIEKLGPIQPFSFAFHPMAAVSHVTFDDRVIAAGGENFFPQPKVVNETEGLFERNARRVRLMTVLDEKGYVYVVDNKGVKDRIARLPVEKADNAKRIHVLSDPWTHRWIAIVPEGLPRFWLVDSSRAPLDDSNSEPENAVQFDLKENESVLSAVWTVRGRKPSLTIATDSGNLVVLDPVTEKTKSGKVGDIAAIIPAINDRGEVLHWNMVASDRTLSILGDLPSDGTADVEVGQTADAIKSLPFLPIQASWQWGRAYENGVLLGLTPIKTGETATVLQTKDYKPSLWQALSVRPEQCRILASTTMADGSFYWLATAPNRVLHLQTLGNITDQMSLGKRILGACLVPDGTSLKMVLAQDNEVNCWSIAIPKAPTPPAKETISPTERPRD